MSEKKFLDGKKTYLGAIIGTLVSIAPDVQLLLALEGEFDTFNFWIPLAKIAIGAFTMFGRLVAEKRITKEVTDKVKAEVPEVQL